MSGTTCDSKELSDEKIEMMARPQQGDANHDQRVGGRRRWAREEFWGEDCDGDINTTPRPIMWEPVHIKLR